MSSTLVTARSPTWPKKFHKHKGGTKQGNEQRGPTQSNKRPRPLGPQASGNPNHKQNKNYPQQHRMSPPSGTLLERIGGIDEAPTLPNPCVALEPEDDPEGSDMSVSSATPHFYTPEPGEVERFLESVIGAPPAAPFPVHASSGTKPSLALGTHNLAVKVEDTSSAVLYSPTQSAVSAGHFQKMLPSSIEGCRKHLIPVLIASAQARGAARPRDSEQCLALLSDDYCSSLIQKAKEMRHQLSSLLSEKTPVNQGCSGSLKRDRADEVDAWVRDTRSRFNSVNSVVSDMSRRGSDITLVDPGRSPSLKAPRAILQPRQLNTENNGVLEDSPTTTKSPPTNQNQPGTDTDMDATNAPTEHSASGRPTPVSSTSTDDQPTQPGIWFNRQGRRFAEIVDVELEVSDDMFHLSSERYVSLPTSTVHAASSIPPPAPRGRPSRLRMHLHLSSVAVGAGDSDALQVIERRACQWPKKGKLVVQINPDSERRKTWLPHALTSDPLDVTACMRPGKNVFRFIQLADLSEFTFVLVASPLPPSEEEWRSWDWASLVDARARSSSSTDDPTNSLSEFARVPVTVLS